MPFDCAPIVDRPNRFDADFGDFSELAAARTGEPVRPRPIPVWHASRRPECVGDTLGLLARARALLADEQRWCQGSFARTWLNIPVPVQSTAARRYCAVGAIMRAGRELGLSAKDACIALEWQTARPVQNWNDDPARTHGDVLAAFDATIAELSRIAV